MKQDNRGYSLVELMVAIAIMGVLAGMFVMGLGIIPRTAAKSCANDLKTAIGHTRVMTMGKNRTEFELRRDASDGCYYAVEWVDDGNGTLVEGVPQLCGKSSVSVSYHVESPGVDPTTDLGNYQPIAEGDSIIFRFDRGNGKMIQGGKKTDSTKCDGVLVEGGGAKYQIRIYTATGKISLED